MFKKSGQSQSLGIVSVDMPDTTKSAEVLDGDPKPAVKQTSQAGATK